jgi:hypothetical protein
MVWNNVYSSFPGQYNNRLYKPSNNIKFKQLKVYSCSLRKITGNEDSLHVHKAWSNTPTHSNSRGYRQCWQQCEVMSAAGDRQQKDVFRSVSIRGKRLSDQQSANLYSGKISRNAELITTKFRIEDTEFVRLKLTAIMTQKGLCAHITCI